MAKLRDLLRMKSCDQHWDEYFSVPLLKLIGDEDGFDRVSDGLAAWAGSFQLTTLDLEQRHFWNDLSDHSSLGKAQTSVCLSAKYVNRESAQNFKAAKLAAAHATKMRRQGIPEAEEIPDTRERRGRVSVRSKAAQSTATGSKPSSA